MGELDESDLLTRPREVCLDLRNWRSGQYLKLIFSYFCYSRACWIRLLEPAFAPYMHHKVLAAFDPSSAHHCSFHGQLLIDTDQCRLGTLQKTFGFGDALTQSASHQSLCFLMFPASNTSVFEEKTLICCLMYCSCMMRTSWLIPLPVYLLCDTASSNWNEGI